ncbi:MAG: glycoside hydrolase family 97 protein [Bacteroidaceae bacterium]|nr:glycoside hydrolase family 97 protein [Bacteroidaceae bacterium]
MKKRYVALCLAMASILGGKAEVVVSSPDGRISVDFQMSDGSPTYSVIYDGQVAILPSALGLKTTMGDYTKELSWQKERIVTGEYTGTYALPSIKVGGEHSYRYNQVTLLLLQKERPAMQIEFRVSNTDVAFRYILHTKRDTRSCVITSEASTFRVSEHALTYMTPQSYPMGGFARTTPSYETKYTLGEPVGRNGWGNGYTFPCLFEVPNDDDTRKMWILVSETGTDGGYVGCRLLGGNGGEYRIGFPMEGEMNGWGTSTVQMALPGSTPWRTITVGHTPANIIETTVTWDLLEEKYPASKDYAKDYGKGMWSWIIGMDGSCNYQEQKRYIDFAAAMGYRSLLIDALWDVQIGRERIAELSRYAQSKGVGLYLWYNSNGKWNDAPQSPRGIMDNPRERRKEMKWMQENGILGIKVDFFGGDKQAMMQYYEDILADANDFGIMCIFHGCTLPRGWERLYPNYVSSEAILASENLHFSQGFCDEEARDCGAMYPFTRNAVGAMDFGGSALNKYYNVSNERGSRRITSDIYALATAVLFQSPVQHFALAPNNLTDAPEYAIDFMKEVPTRWDEVRYIDGYPGKYVILARRSGNKWYIAGVNAMNQPLKQTLSLPMLQAKQPLTLYMNGEKKMVKLSRKQTIDVEIPTTGGLVVVQ